MFTVEFLVNVKLASATVPEGYCFRSCSLFHVTCRITPLDRRSNWVLYRLIDDPIGSYIIVGAAKSYLALENIV
jgi:hypothetical protein